MSVTSISEAKLKLYQLVRKAEGGEDVVLEYEGRPIARILAIPPNDLAEERARAIDAAHAALQGVVFEETCAARSQDFLYDEDGLPA